MAGKRIVICLAATAGAAGALLLTRAACRGREPFDAIAIAFRDERIETIGEDGWVRLLDRHFKEFPARPFFTSPGLWGAAFSADGTVVAFTDQSSVIHVKRVGGTTETRIETEPHWDALALGPGGLVGVLSDDECRIYRGGVLAQTIRAGSHGEARCPFRKSLTSFLGVSLIRPWRI